MPTTVRTKVRETLGIKKLKTKRLLQKAARLAKKQGVSLETLLAELHEIRHHV